MNRETIEKAARKYATDKYGGEYTKQWAIAQIHSGRDGFIDGARWRSNAAWHGLDELPEPDVTVIVEYIIDGHAEYVFTHLSENANVVTNEYGFCFYVNDGEITRWAYIDDLLPDGKEGHP